MTDHYATLGLKPDADPATIRAAYIELMRRYHPDRAGAEADSVKAQEVTAAYEVLRDPERRAAHDRRLARERGAPVSIAPAVAAGRAGSPVRGGHLGRNLFFLIVAGTGVLAWQMTVRTQPVPAGHSGAVAARQTAATPEPQLAPSPVPDKEPMVDEPPVAVAAAQVPLPSEPEMELPPLPEVRHPVAMATPRPVPSPAPVRTPARSIPAKAVAPAPSPAPASDLAELDRHLVVLTDQSFRFGTAAKRARLVATGDAFAAKLKACATDSCRRDSYLRRNEEVAEIMRN